MWIYLNLATIAMAKESYDEAKEVVEYYFNNFADNAVLHYVLARNYAYQGKLDLALAEVDKASILAPNNYTNQQARGNISLIKGELVEAEKEYKKLLTSEEPRALYEGLIGLVRLNLLQGKFHKARENAEQCIAWAEKTEETTSKTSSHLRLAYIHSLSGNIEKALKEVDESWKTAVASDLIGYQRWNYRERGFYLIEMGLFDKAQEAIDEFKARIDKGIYKYEIRDYYALMGHMELKRGNFPKAIEYTKKALSMIPYGPLNKPIRFHEVLALAYYESGNLNKAQDGYEKITELTLGRLNYGDIYAKSFCMLGKISEQQGDTPKAIEHYEKFLDLCKDADPGIAEVEDARERLAVLKGENP